MKGIWIKDMHLDVTDDASEADINEIVSFIGKYQKEQTQMQADFDYLWLNASKRLNNGIDQKAALEWFKIGYELAIHRATPVEPQPARSVWPGEGR